MASGYIGKISAIVTANTSDLSRKLSQSSKEANAFAVSLRSSIDRAGTNAQKSLEKIFTPLQQLERQLKAASFRSLDLKLPVDEVRAFVSAAEAINKPLERASSSFSKLSTEVQAGFKPALDAAQAAAVNLNQQIATTGTASASSFQIAASEARKAEQAIQRLAQAQQIAAKALTGRELQFSNPAAFASLNRTAELTQQAGRLPAGALEGSDIANRVAKLNGLSQSISVGLTKLESLRIDPVVNTTQIEQAEKKLNSLLAAARRAQDGLRSAIDVQANIGASSPFMSTRDPQGRSIPERLSSNLLSQQLQDANALAASQQELARKIGNGFLTILTPAEAAADTLQAKQQELARKIGNGFLTILTPAEAAADTLQAKQQELARKIGNGFLTILTQAEAAADTVVGRVSSGRSAGANNLRDAFGGRTEAGINFGFEQQALSAYTAQLQVLQRAIGSASAEARGPAVAAFSRLRDTIANAMDRGELETRETRDEIRRLTQEAVAASASVAGISAKALGRSVTRAGDVSRRGFDNISLALNQAAFAVDDFFSSTGGLEFKIRAVQNNLTQLGFILGGTAGLFTALGFAIAGQATIALVNFINEGRKTEDMVKALNDSLMRQKEVAEEVGTAFNDIGKELRSDVFSDAANDADRLTASLEKIADAFKRLREERIAQPSVTAQEAQATVNSLERRLKTEEDPGVRVLLQRQLLEAQTKRTEVNATLSSPITVAGGIARFREAITPLEESRGSGTQQRLTREQIGRNIDSVISNADIRDFAGLRAAVEARFDETAAIVNTGEGAFRAFRGANSDVAADEIGNLQSLLVSIQGFQKAGEALTNAARVSDNIGNSLADARDRIEDFGEGVESSQEFSDAVDEQARILSEAVSTISESFSKLDKLEITPEEFLESLNAAAAKVDAEAAKRAQLIARIEDVFNEEEVSRREADEERAKEIDSRLTKAIEERQQSAERGADLVRSPGERLAKEVLDSILDIQNAFGLRTPENLARAQPSVESFLGEQRRSIAPALFTLQDTIANAVLQGPSRAALNAADVTTTQGTAELNRLLRGDDPARDQNLLELQKQTAELEKLNQTLGAAGVAD